MFTIVGGESLDQASKESAPPAEVARQKSGKQGAGGMQGDDEVIGVQEQAAATLSDLAFGDSAMQGEIISAGGVPPLLALLKSGSIVSQEHAARATWTLCMAPENQKVIVDSGAIPELVALCKTGSESGKGYAAAVISELAKGAIAAASTASSADGGEDSTPNEASSQLTQCAAAIAPLVALVNNGNRMGKEHGVGALSVLSSITTHRDAVAKAGGIPPIVQLLDDGTANAHELVVSALASLADGSPDNQTQIAKKLVALVSCTHTCPPHALNRTPPSRFPFPPPIPHPKAQTPSTEHTPRCNLLPTPPSALHPSALHPP